MKFIMGTTTFFYIYSDIFKALNCHRTPTKRYSLRFNILLENILKIKFSEYPQVKELDYY